MKYQIISTIIISLVVGFIVGFYETKINLLEEELKSTYKIDCEWIKDDK
jgi:uncharacterized protein YneF (UPF0154 family)